ncbi:MAG: peptidylprolyl isomerase, partial [Opitutaceae bacterium]|nr:peptidylprolyl isomerase [Opitutaceae bacterium]
RVVDGFVVQGGDPLGNGEGGPGYEFPDEFTPRLKHDTVGTLAMANSGPNTNGSQFYFTLNPVDRLNYKHTVFGRVVRGVGVLPSVKQGDALLQVRITRVGPAAEAFHPSAESFAALRASSAVIAPRDPALPPLFVEGARLDLPEFYPAWLNDKLHHYARVRGVTIHVRTLPALEGGADADAVSAAVAALHEQLAGRDPRSATLVYGAEDKRWRLWLGDGLLGILGARPDRIHDVKEQILAGAAKQVEEGVARRSIDAAVTDLIEAIDRGEYPAN